MVQVSEVQVSEVQVRVEFLVVNGDAGQATSVSPSDGERSESSFDAIKLTASLVDSL